MRIGIDYTAAVWQGGGIGRYTRSLVRALVELDSGHTFKLFVAGGMPKDAQMERWPDNVRTYPVPISDRWTHIIWQRLRLPVPIQLVMGGIDLFHSPDFVLPPTGSAGSILTVHDLSFLTVPQFFVPEFRRYLEGAVTRAVRKAQHILADSRSTQADLVDLLGVDPDRITVLYPGVDQRFRPVEDTQVLSSVRRRYRLPGRFLLGLSTLQPRKNFEGLVDAFGLVATDRGLQPGMADLDLVVVGEEGWLFEGIAERVQARGLADRVHFLGRVPDDDLPAVYSLAEVFAFPTWYEGFGIPVVEAMACGTPVVASDNSSLPEAVGNAGIMVDAGDTTGLADGIVCILSDGALRSRLVSEGFKHTRQFSWRRSAEQLLSVIETFA